MAVNHRKTAKSVAGHHGIRMKAMGRTPSGRPHHETTASRARLGSVGDGCHPRLSASPIRDRGRESMVIAEAVADGILIRPAVVLPVEVYTPERKRNSCSRTRWTRKIISRPFARSDRWAWTPTRSPTTSRRGLTRRGPGLPGRQRRSVGRTTAQGEASQALGGGTRHSDHIGLRRRGGSA